jgi:hypothetical protein
MVKLVAALALVVCVSSCTDDQVPDPIPDAGSGGDAGSDGGAGRDSASAGTSGAGGSGGSSGGGTGGRDSGGPDTATDGSFDGADGDAGSDDAAPAPVLNGCTAYADRTAPSASRSLPWDESIAGLPERCIKVSVGQSITFAGDLGEHPVVAYGGDMPNPIPGPFTVPGVFGYLCTAHSEMIGAVWVVEN